MPLYIYVHIKWAIHAISNFFQDDLVIQLSNGIFPVDMPAADALQILLCLLQGYTTQSTLFSAYKCNVYFILYVRFLNRYIMKEEKLGFEEMLFNHHIIIVILFSLNWKENECAIDVKKKKN